MNRLKIYLKFNKKLSPIKVHDPYAVIAAKINLNQLKPYPFYLNQLLQGNFKSCFANICFIWVQPMRLFQGQSDGI